MSIRPEAVILTFPESPARVLWELIKPLSAAPVPVRTMSPAFMVISPPRPYLTLSVVIFA